MFKYLSHRKHSRKRNTYIQLLHKFFEQEIHKYFLLNQQFFYRTTRETKDRQQTILYFLFNLYHTLIDQYKTDSKESEHYLFLKSFMKSYMHQKAHQ